MSAEVMVSVIKNGPRGRAALWVLYSLAYHCDAKGGNCWPSTEEIAAEQRLSTRTVHRKVAELEKDGWITVRRRSVWGKGNSYQIVLSKLRGVGVSR
jgi:DNA-binding IscR family transcriptional regulator